MFHMDIAKIDGGVAYVVMVNTCMLQESIINVSSVFLRYML